MSEPDPIPRNPVASGRLRMPPIETVTAAKDTAMRAAFGLQDDTLHWMQMKADAIEICLAVLPPANLSSNIRMKLGLDKEQFIALGYSRDAKEIKDYVWEFALRPWKEKYYYDLRYLQKRYPDESIRDHICECIARWNEACGNTFRRHVGGRNLKQVYLDLTKEQDTSIRDKTGISPSCQRQLSET